jgi:hypothetical protein
MALYMTAIGACDPLVRSEDAAKGRFFDQSTLINFQIGNR